MGRYLVTVSWIEHHVEQACVGAEGAYEAAAEARVAMREKYGDRGIRTSGGEDFRVLEVQAINGRPKPPGKMPKGKWAGGGISAGHKKAPAAAKAPAPLMRVVSSAEIEAHPNQSLLAKDYMAMATPLEAAMSAMPGVFAAAVESHPAAARKGRTIPCRDKKKEARNG